MYTLLLCMANFIRNRSTNKNKIKKLQGFGQMAQTFISSIYEVGWNLLEMDEDNKTLRQNVSIKFTPKVKVTKPVRRSEQSKDKQLEIVRPPPSILVRPLKEVLKKLKFFKKGNISKENTKPKKQSYAQALAPNISNILKINQNFPNLSVEKIEDIHQIINGSDKIKPKINMMTKRPFKKQVIIPIDNNNKQKFMSFSNAHIANINSALKSIKSQVIADFVHMKHLGIIITINKVTSLLDLQTIKNYVKNAEHIEFSDLEIP